MEEQSTDYGIDVSYDEYVDKEIERSVRFCKMLGHPLTQDEISKVRAFYLMEALSIKKIK